MLDIIRDSTFGQLARLALPSSTSARLFPYPEERPGYVVPAQYRRRTTVESDRSETATIVERDIDAPLPPTQKYYKQRPEIEEGAEGWAGEEKSEPESVDWYDEQDQENPHSIYTASIPGLMEAYNSSLVVATLGLSLFVAFYGLGPSVLVPLQELPSLGRNPVYLISLALFALFTMSSAVAQNMATVLVTRALAGFFGSPALATGGATLADMWPQKNLAYVIGLWSMGAVLGPVAAPTIGGFSAMNLGWRWPLWILFFINCFSWIILFFLLPETFHANILYKRAARLRAVTARQDIKSHGQKEQEALSFFQLMKNSLTRPLLLLTDPAPAFLSIYLGFCYALFYLFFESFPLVFGEIYHFNLGQQGLAFLGYFVTGIITFIVYCSYQKWYINPLYSNGNEPEPEVRLNLALYTSVMIPISTFFFGWVSRESVHWIVPIIAASLYLPGIFLLFQSIIMYLTMSYYTFAGSILAANALARSLIASVFPLFGHALFSRLGLGPGSSLLGALSILMILPLFFIRRYGKVLRSKSKYAPDSTKEVVKNDTVDSQASGSTTSTLKVEPTEVV
ncbi:hypothetical protein QFC19_009132 [Naganishia cerealis]|uniref:Uncharacterized protein n=1 Tax=Naganishia cerealis TaxID=610337 RepID=A0ACC2UXC2_9TREE|nr:hypothetical protein QFC19_009132 [Naganishia cerealis]